VKTTNDLMRCECGVCFTRGHESDHGCRWIPRHALDWSVWRDIGHFAALAKMLRREANE
jgi:hypothetical protein